MIKPLHSFYSAFILSTCLTALCTPTWGATAEINGFEMYYEVFGEGEPVVVLHGIARSGADEKPWANELAKEFQVIMPDLRGHGASTNPSGEFTHRQSALDVFALLDHLGLDRVSAAGFSTGGMTLLHMATQQPDRMEAIVLRGAQPYLTEQSREINRNTDPNNVPEDEMQELRALHKHGDEQIIALLSQFNSFANNHDDMIFTPPLLSTIEARTLIVLGDRDRFVPARIALEMYEAIPDSYLWIVPNAGHGAGARDEPEYFARTAASFLRGEW